MPLRGGPGKRSHRRSGPCHSVVVRTWNAGDPARNVRGMCGQDRWSSLGAHSDERHRHEDHPKASSNNSTRNGVHLGSGNTMTTVARSPDRRDRIVKKIRRDSEPKARLDAAADRRTRCPATQVDDVARAVGRNSNSQCLFNSEEVEAKWWLRDGSSLLVKPECLRTRHRW